MQKAAETTTSQSLPGATLSDFPATAQYVPLSQFKLNRPNGAVAGFDPTEISVVEPKPFLSVYGGLGAASVRIREFAEGPTAGADSAAHRVAECKASQDCGLWLRFDDVLEESALPGNLLVVREFLRWRNVERFCRLEVDAAVSTRVRDDEIRLDPENPYQDLLSGRPGNRFGSAGLAPSAE